ncbi:hypothetical protein [Cardinium endosymbiont of Tipula unca]|uniref:hypothetical protein n=1 Tax=Cardinium endosymbiont of Tipula unca TaxID=3066216 RepID=UPI0030D519C8
MLFCSIKGANRGYIQVLLATSRNRIYFRRRSIDYKFKYGIGYSISQRSSEIKGKNVFRYEISIIQSSIVLIFHGLPLFPSYSFSSYSMSL